MISLTPPQPNSEPKHLYNPSKEDFSVNYAFEKENPKTYTIHAGEIASFPSYLADHIAKHLSRYILGQRKIKTNYEDDLKEILKEILVEV